ncbi:hypothetical protein J1605_010398 [Eschrichtius robustus]|uniref:PB1 domain-containing protein n=1 Tax=Eschrichtius robustus TaxID=9764 RepID=A0AB34GRR2_ESCRO|nr:hypothetical protein J1605_010398 [Eschrichtius robustus]
MGADPGSSPEIAGQWPGGLQATLWASEPEPGADRKEFGAEFRRFSLDRQKPGKFEDFYKLVVHTHHISNTEVTIGYADVHGDLLPINNDDNFCKAVSSANPLLRVFIQKRVLTTLGEQHGGGDTVLAVVDTVLAVVDTVLAVVDFRRSPLCVTVFEERSPAKPSAHAECSEHAGRQPVLCTLAAAILLSVVLERSV